MKTIYGFKANLYKAISRRMSARGTLQVFKFRAPSPGKRSQKALQRSLKLLPRCMKKDCKKIRQGSEKNGSSCRPR